MIRSLVEVDLCYGKGRKSSTSMFGKPLKPLKTDPSAFQTILSFHMKFYWVADKNQILDLKKLMLIQEKHRYHFEAKYIYYPFRHCRNYYFCCGKDDGAKG